MDAEVQIKELQGSKIWQIDNVLEEPDKLARFLFSRQTAPIAGSPWEDNEKLYFKGRYFDFNDAACPVVWLAQRLCQQTIDFGAGFKTNVEAWLKDIDNDYSNNYWFPHIDNGYNCIIYLNKNSDTNNGTNLYDPSIKEEKWFKSMMEDPEGSKPWIPKGKLKLLEYIEPQYNRLILFDGNKFPHGTAVNNEQYFFQSLEGNSPRSYRSNITGCH